MTSGKLCNAFRCSQNNVLIQTLRMPLNETIETFEYLLREAERLDLAYVCFLRYTESFDQVLDGRCSALRCIS